MLYVQTLSNHTTYVFSSFDTSFANKPFRPTPSRLPSCIRPSRQCLQKGMLGTEASWPAANAIAGRMCV